MNDTTTVPAGPAEVRYLADALGDYLDQHAGPRSASRAVAERLGAVLPPAVLNLVTDALDAPRGPSADLVIVDDPFLEALERAERADYCGTPPAHEYDGPHYDAPVAQG